MFVCQKENENIICISPFSLFLQQTACKESIRVHCPPVATTMASEVKSPFLEASWQYMKVLSTAFFISHRTSRHRTSRHCTSRHWSSTLCQQKCLRPIRLLLFLSHSRRHVVPDTHSSSYLPISIRIPHISTMRQLASPSFQTSKSKDKYQPLRPKLYHQLLLPVFSTLTIL